LYESPVIVGSSRAYDTGMMAIDLADRKQPTLVLQVDALPTAQPPGADPLDIRDVCNWLEPQLQLNAAALRDEIPPRAERSIAAFSGWELDEVSRPLRLTNLLQENPLGRNRFVTAATGRNGKIVLHREFDVGPQTNWLIARAVGRSVDPGKPPRANVDIDGETAAEFAIGPQPATDPGRPSAAIPLLSHVGKRVRVTVTQTTSHRDDAVHWSELSLCDASPPLLAALEDDAELTSVDEGPGGGARFVDDDFHTGTRCLRIDAEGRYRLAVPGGVRIRETPEFGEHRWLRFAFRKFGGGRVGLGFEHADMRERLARYDAGKGPPCHGFARRLWQVQLPPEWIVQFVDVYEDFGALDIEAVELSVPDGEYALFDHVYFARSPDDFRWLPPGPSADEANRIARRTLAKAPREKGLPAVVLIDRGNGQMGTGTIVDGEMGYVLTAGHSIAGDKTTFDVYLSDGRKVAARRLGIDRSNDVGVLKLDVMHPVPAVEVDFRLHDEYPRDSIYLAVSHATDGTPGQDPAEYLVTVRGMVEGSLATDMQLEGQGRGGPLLDAEGRLIGVHTRQTGGSGEFLYSRACDFAAGWQRLIKGEIWGHWLSGVGPKIGVIVTTRPEGCQIIQVTTGTPAAAAGLQPEDWIRQLDGQPVSSLSDMARLLAGRDPDEVVTLDIRRDRRSFKVKLKLMQHRRQMLGPE
jgi:serine protease Do